MSDSNRHEELTEKHETIRQHRIEGIKRWIAYMKAHPPAIWGEQQNRLVNSQLKSARESGLDAEHYQRIERARHERSVEHHTPSQVGDRDAPLNSNY